MGIGACPHCGFNDKDQDLDAISPTEATIAPLASAVSNNTVLGKYDATDYRAAKGVASFIAAIGWLVVVAGIIISIFGLVRVSQMGPFALMMLPFGVGIGASGLLLVASAQVTRATVDSANHLGQILAVLKAQINAQR
jgi:hypothetical protein